MQMEQNDQKKVRLLLCLNSTVCTNPKNWLNSERKWDYLYETCESCKGSGNLNLS